MNKINLRKRIKGILTIIIILLISNTEITKVYGDEITYRSSSRIVNWYYATTTNDAETLNQARINKFFERPVYALSIGKHSTNIIYNYTEDYQKIGYTKEDIDNINLIAYYGYEYSNHTEDKLYHIAAQKLIWDYLGQEETKLVLKNSNSIKEIETKSYEEEILELVENHKIKPSFSNKSFEYNLGNKIKIQDNNNVLSNYEIIDSAGLNIKLEENNLIVESNVIGEYIVKLKRRSYIDNKVTILYNDSTVKYILPGSPDDSEITINIKITGATLNISKKIKDSSYKSLAKYLKLNNAQYELYDQNNNLIKTITTNIEGQASIDDLKYGSYKLIEKNSSYGYLSDKKIYNITITSNEEELIIYNDLILKKIEIYKTYGNDYKKEEGATFDIIEENGNIYTSITTDKNGYTSIMLPYGKYQIKETSSKINSKLVDSFEIEINSETKDTLSYNLNSELIKANEIINPKTSDKISKNIIKLIISGILLIILILKIQKSKLKTI